MLQRYQQFRCGSDQASVRFRIVWLAIHEANNCVHFGDQFVCPRNDLRASLPLSLRSMVRACVPSLVSLKVQFLRIGAIQHADYGLRSLRQSLQHVVDLKVKVLDFCFECGDEFIE